MKFSAIQIATLVNGIVEGDNNATVNTFAKIEEGHPGAISFLANPKYTNHIYNTESSIVLVRKDFVPEQPNPKVFPYLIEIYVRYKFLVLLLFYIHCVL